MHVWIGRFLVGGAVAVAAILLGAMLAAGSHMVAQPGGCLIVDSPFTERDCPTGRLFVTEDGAYPLGWVQRVSVESAPGGSCRIIRAPGDSTNVTMVVEMGTANEVVIDYWE